MKQKIYLTAAVCLLCLSQAQARTDYNINAPQPYDAVIIKTNGEDRISGDGTPTTNTIKVNSGVVADIILENVNIETYSDNYWCAFDMAGATVTLRLAGTNTIKSGHNYAGLHVPAGSTLKITSISGDGSTDGSLNVTSGSDVRTKNQGLLSHGAGIGGGNGSIRTPTTITGSPVIFASAINGTPSNPRNGIITKGDVNINPLNKTITLNSDFIVPENALLTLPEDWMLDTNGKLFIIGRVVMSAAASPAVEDISTTVDEASPITVRFYNKILSINSPVAEQIEVYSMSGNPLFKASKPAGKAFFTIPNPEWVLIVRGSSGWVKSIIAD
ncbi:MAG: hypothetical protein LBE71_02300 [Dysgonamonadaceae bacterium]|jgi:hypothetical protein|nr:hypothetical protein [Dysgonamonadaceae bacterium]